MVARSKPGGARPGRPVRIFHGPSGSSPGAWSAPSGTISRMHRPVQTCADLAMSVVSEKAGIHKSLYVRAADLELWRRAEAYARERRMTTSGLVMAALERYLDSEAGKDSSSR